MTLGLPFDNSYAKLPDRFYARLAPTPVKDPALIALNEPLAGRLGLDPKLLSSPEGVTALAGNVLPTGAQPLAQAYAGHQFGNFVPQLGDGRAILLGEVIAPDGQRFDIQLKGSGPTPFSRNGDGRAWVGPVLREYIMSEAMAALGVPTTRAMAAVTTGETVMRQAPLPGAILTRVATSHLRVGTFQYFAAREDTDALQTLVAHALSRHDPDRKDALGLLAGTVERQAKLMAHWLALGFVHGVMNTDNTAISGETIDYGPCAFIDAYHPMRVFSSIDHAGRYAYGRQPDVAMWNLAQLAMALLPLIPNVDDAQRQVERFPELFQAAWIGQFRAKLGLNNAQDGDDHLVKDLLTRMAENNADFTNTFRALGSSGAREQFADPESFDTWEHLWRARLEHEDAKPEHRVSDLQKVNPAVIPRTHRIEQAIQAAVNGDFTLFHRLNRALSNPFELPNDMADLARAPAENEVVPQTFCGT